MTSPTSTSAWQTLRAAAAAPAAALGAMSALGPVEAAGIYADFSRQSIDGEVLAALLELAEAMPIASQRKAMFAGGIVNRSERRPALHTALRDDAATPLMVGGVEVRAQIHAQLASMQAFSQAVRTAKRRGVSDQAFTDVVNIGIGGSSLGPAFVTAALAPSKGGPRMHFVSNIDGFSLESTLSGLNPATTLFTVTSKSFTTDETCSNAASAWAWLAAALGTDSEVKAAHFVAITANPAEARRQGYGKANIFEFWEWVGGRYSLWSAVGLPIALAHGYEPFSQLLAGARAMDRHFRDTPAAGNLPVLMALTGIWNRNFRSIGAHAVLPYAERLAMLPRHLQQVEMESTGKSVSLDGLPLDYDTCPVIFGEAGTNGQHSFHQLLHQGSQPVSADILMVAKAQSRLPGHHPKLLANALAQADALWFGQDRAQAWAASAATTDDGERHYQAAQRTQPGRRPVTLLLLPQIDAFHLGALLALYEHKVFTQSVIWNIDAFDQWGVELGKRIARSLLPAINADPATAPAHLQATLAQLRRAAGE
jgi:glucose-6-phosphate isomerase